MPYWRIVFSTFCGCMSFRTGSVKSCLGAVSVLMSDLPESGHGSAIYERNALIGRSEVRVFLHQRRKLVEVLQH
jgi:hypothetical protein